jgi:carbonic anhydrase
MGKLMNLVAAFVIVMQAAAQTGTQKIENRIPMMDDLKWSYSGEYGPEHWTELDPAYADCAGISQSPIDIKSSKCSETSLSLEFHYHPFFVDLINNGHTLIDPVKEEKALTFNGEYYSLLQFHFHTPSEHHVDGKEYPMEIHFVHQNQTGRYTVVGVLVDYGEQQNQFLGHFINSLPKHVNEEIVTEEEANPIEGFPTDLQHFYYYSGSFTTPPCTEGINWIVMENPVTATYEQIEAIHQVVHDDNRPIQKINSRIVFHCGN